MAIDNETAMQRLGDDSRAPLKIRFDLSGDIAQNFAILSDIYNKLYTWDLMVSRAELDAIEGKTDCILPNRKSLQRPTWQSPAHKIR